HRVVVAVRRALDDVARFEVAIRARAGDVGVWGAGDELARRGGLGERISAVGRAGESDRVVPAREVARLWAHARVLIALVLVVDKRVDVLAVVGPDRGDPLAFAVGGRMGVLARGEGRSAVERQMP